jgi:hypothetical protein
MKREPIYRQECEPLAETIARLREVCSEIDAPPELLARLQDAICEVEEASRAKVPITNHGKRVGFGIGQAEKAVACDAAISLLRQIKAVKGW